jgi:hypothetical protein
VLGIWLRHNESMVFIRGRSFSKKLYKGPAQFN